MNLITCFFRSILCALGLIKNNVDSSSSPERDSQKPSFKIWECEVCGFIYNEALGLPKEGIPPGTIWIDIPEDWECPDCGVTKSDFKMVVRKPQPQNLKVNLSESINNDPIVIVGSGLSGYTLAKEFRDLNQQQKILMLTRDGGEYYSKPMLSNALSLDKKPSDLISKNAQKMSSDLNIEIRSGVEVSFINRAQKVLETSYGKQAYSRLVLATGADQRHIEFEGNAAKSILSVNDLNDYTEFRSRLPIAGHVVILGAGLIGCEFANDLINSGYRVTVMDIGKRPLETLVPIQVAELLRHRLEQQGVQWKFTCSLAKIEHVTSRLRCTFSDKTHKDADLVLSAIGLRPRIELAKKSGLVVNRGIVTNAYLQTSDVNIYTLGDCSEVINQTRFFIAPIKHGSLALAKTLAGNPTEVRYPAMPIQVKTTCCPIVHLSPESGAEGHWSVIKNENGMECHFMNPVGQLKGFSLTDAYIGNKNDLLEKLV